MSKVYMTIENIYYKNKTRVTNLSNSDEYTENGNDML